MWCSPQALFFRPQSSTSPQSRMLCCQGMGSAHPGRLRAMVGCENQEQTARKDKSCQSGEWVGWTTRPWIYGSGSNIGIVSCCEFSFFSRPFSVHMKALQTQWGFCSNNNNRLIPKVAGMGILFSNSFILCEVSKEGNCFLLSDVGDGDLGTGGGFPSPSGLGGWGKDQGHYFPFTLVSVQMHPELTEYTEIISFQCLFKWMLFKTICTSKSK